MASEAEETGVDDLRRRLEEVEETLRAIRCGEVDAIVVTTMGEERVFTLQGADRAYRALIESMQQGAVTLNGDSTVLYCNRRFAEMVGRPQERVIGASVRDFVPASFRPFLTTLLLRGSAQGAQGEFPFEAPDGTLTPVYLALSPLPLHESGTMFMIVTDLTEQKQHQDLKVVSRRKDEFLAMLAHELRNPLAPIRNALYLMKRGSLGDSSSEEVRSMMERQVEHLARLIDDLMDVSRISTGMVELRVEEVDLASLLRRAADTSRPLIEQKGHQLSVNFPPGPIRLRADPTRLEQVFDNLLNNSAKYSDPGGRIVLTAVREGDLAVVRLRDTGIGIAPDKLPQIFDLFVQAERRLDRSQGGLGIGLSLVRSLVEMHGGSVSAFSEGLGKGSEFVVRLPALPVDERAEQRQPGNGQTHHVASLPKRRVLVVDDNVDSARSMSLILMRMWGQVVEIAIDGKEALEKFGVFRPEIVLLDLGLPGMSGFEVAERLRRLPGGREPVLVAMTGWGQEDDLLQSRNAGFAHHLVKPVDLDALRALIASGPVKASEIGRGGVASGLG